MDKMDTLWKGAAYQDHLLQSYRHFHLTMQTILIAAGAGLCLAAIALPEYYYHLVYILLIAISALGIYVLVTMSKLIKARAEDVDYYHQQIINEEKILPKEQQVLTAFKVYQKFSRDRVRSNEFFASFLVTEAIRNQLTEKGEGHTRQILDVYQFRGYYMVWFTFHVVAIGKLFM